VESGRTLEEELADEIRAAIRETRPPEAAEPDDRRRIRGSAADALRRAEAYATPSVPEGARFAFAKRVLLRLFRFLWRDQAAFDALTLDALRAMLSDADRLEITLEGVREGVGRELAESRRRAAIQDSRFALLERVAPDTSAAASAAPTARASRGELPAAVYSLFEERFRGSPAEIAEGQRAYLPFLAGAPGPVLDAGCGRGELLALLRDAGIPALGVESNPISARLCREAGLAVEEADAYAYVAARPPESLGAVVALQVVEHWTAAATFAFLVEARRALRPGGTLLLETINTDSLSALRAFFLDPTHVRPVPPAALAFLAEAAGFADCRIEYRSPIPESARLEERSSNDAKLNRLLFAAQDYALVARVPRE